MTTATDTLPIWTVISPHLPAGELLTMSDLDSLCRDAGYGAPHIGGPGPGVWAATHGGIREQIAVADEQAQDAANKLLLAHQPTDPYGGRPFGSGRESAPAHSGDVLAALIRTGYIATVSDRLNRTVPQTTPQGMRHLWGRHHA